MGFRSSIAYKDGICPTMDTSDDAMHHFGTTQSITYSSASRSYYTPARALTGEPAVAIFFFIMCTGVLVANIEKAENDKRLTGLKVTRASLAISHLLFEDASLLFYKA